MIMDTTIVNTVAEGVGAMDFLLDNWAALVLAGLAFIKVLVNLTPTESDNQVFGYFDALINMVINDRIKKPEE
jgi:hypothetical protein